MSEPTLVQILEDDADSWRLLAMSAEAHGNDDLAKERRGRAARLRAAATRLREALGRARSNMALADSPNGFTVQKRTLVEQTLLAINTGSTPTTTPGAQLQDSRAGEGMPLGEPTGAARGNPGPVGTAPTPGAADIPHCVCPFPRVSCPSCPHDCYACGSAALAGHPTGRP